MSLVEANPLGVGLVGCGRIAATYLEALGGVAECRLLGVADVDEVAARRAVASQSVASYADYRRLLDGEPVEAVIVCTPPGTHAEIAGYFLDHGCHVLCEKPLAVTSAEAEGLVAKAEAAGRLLMMASKFRYVDDVLEAKRIIDSGTIGGVILYENVFCSRVDMRGRWNATRALGGGGVLIDNGTHSVDIARFLLGPIAQVQAEEGLRVQGLEVEDTCRLSFRTEGGAMGSVDLSWSIQKERESYIEVFGPEGMLSVGWRGSKYRRSDKHDWVTFGAGYDKIGAFARQLQNFAAAARGVDEPLITVKDCLESVRVIEAAYRSMAMDKWLLVGDEHSRESTG